jgi:phosphoesterase RecJ-like protein
MHTPPLPKPLPVASLAEKIRQARTIILTTHKQCDGDGLGALLGLYHGLKKLDKKIRVLSVDAVPKKYNFLRPEKYTESFEGPHTPIGKTDLTLIFDTNDRRLVEPLFTALEPHCPEILFVDHHPVLTNGPSPTPGSFIDTRAASTGEISFYLIKELGIAFDADIALALYTSIVFDTQLFKFVKNSPVSHLMAAELLAHVPNAEDVHRHLFSTHTIEKVAFLSKVLGEIEYFGDGRVAISKLRAQDLTNHNLDMDDSRDVIDMIMNINSLEAAGLFREDAPNEYKLSLRSKGKIEVLSIAESFHGGGHLYAAGATIHGSFTDIKKRVVAALLKTLDAAPKATGYARTKKSKKS